MRTKTDDMRTKSDDMRSQKTYLFVTVDGGGNLPQVLGLAERLHRRGHRIFVLTEPCLKPLIDTMGLQYIPFREYFTRTDRKEDLLRDHRATTFSNPVLDTVVFGPAETVANQTLEALKTSGADVLVADVLLPGALIAGEYLGILSAA